MKLRLKYFISVNIGFGLLGIIFIFWGISDGGAIARPMLESIGVGLLAAGFVNILDRAITLEPAPLPPDPIQRIDVVAEKRLVTPQEIWELKYITPKVDIIGVSLTHILEEIVDDPSQKIIDRLLKHNLQMRLFFVHPNSPYLNQRAIEDKRGHAELINRQKRAVQLSLSFYAQLNTAYDLAKKAGSLNTHATGSLQIKLLEFCPYISIYRLGEDDIYWGLYTSSTPGINLPLFKTNSSVDPSLHKHLHQHIHGLLERDVKYPSLVNMLEMGKPTINQNLIDSILGSDVTLQITANF